MKKGFNNKTHVAACEVTCDDGSRRDVPTPPCGRSPPWSLGDPDPASVHGGEHDFLTNASSAGTYPTEIIGGRIDREQQRKRAADAHHQPSAFYLRLVAGNGMICAQRQQLYTCRSRRNVNHLFRKFPSHSPRLIYIFKYIKKCRISKVMKRDGWVRGIGSILRIVPHSRFRRTALRACDVRIEGPLLSSYGNQGFCCLPLPLVASTSHVRTRATVKHRIVSQTLQSPA